MSAPKGNGFWKLRSKHGRDTLFATPGALWEAACEYFESVDNNPFYETKPMSVSNGMMAGSEIQLIQIPVKRPYTLHALCTFFDCSTSWLRNFKANTKDEGFLTVIEQIEETIYNQKFEGAAAGFFNANIISRDLGLKDSIDNNITDNRKQIADLFPPDLDKPDS